MRSILLLTMIAFGSSLTFAEEIQTGSLSGRVLEKGTKKALAGVNLFLEPIDEMALSDDSGRFRFLKLPPGEYQLVAAVINYRKPEPTIIEVRGGEDRTITLYLEREPISMLEIIVEAERKPPDPGRQTLKREEVQKIPGSAGDLIMAVQNLPGIIAAGGFSGTFLARGSGPQDNAVLLDQMPILLPFHFVGFISTINSDLIKSMDFYSGGFGVRYGDAMGAVLDIMSREGQRDRVGSRINLSPVLVEGRVEGPVGEHASFLIAGRRGLLEYLPLPTDEGTTAIPAFNDYQGKLSYALSDRHQLSLLFIGSHDAFLFETDDPDPRDPIITDFSSHVDFHTQGLHLRSALTPRLTSTLTLFNNYQTDRFTLGPDLFLEDVVEQVRLKGHFVYEVPAHTLATGFEFGQAWFSVDSRFVQPCPPEGDPGCTLTDAPQINVHLSDTAYGGSLYLEDTLHIQTRLDLTAGGRMDFFSPTRALDLGPRLSALFHLSDRQRIKAAFGYYYQWPRPEEFIEGFGTPDIQSNRSVHYVLGYDYQFTSAIDLDLQAYYKDMDHLVVLSDNPNVVYDNDGVGYAAGAEVLLRHQLTNRFFGWISYAYSTTERRNHPGEDWRISGYDRPHTGTLLGSYQLTHRWNLGARWRFASGAPYTPIIGNTFDPVENRYRPVFGKVNSRRFPSSHRLDLRMEYKKTYDTWILTTYFEIWNAYNRRNPIGFDYSDDFSEKELITEPGIIPFLGITAEF